MSLKCLLVTVVALCTVVWASELGTSHEEPPNEHFFNTQIFLRVIFRIHGPKDKSQPWNCEHPDYNTLKRARCHHIDLMDIASKSPDLTDFSVTIPLPLLLKALDVAMSGLHEEQEVELVTMNGFTHFKEMIHIYTEIDGKKVNVTENFAELRMHILRSNLEKLVGLMTKEDAYAVQEAFPKVFPAFCTIL